MSHQKRLAQVTTTLTALQSIMSGPVIDHNAEQQAVELMNKIARDDFQQAMDIEPETRAWANNLLRQWARLMQAKAGKHE